MVVDGFRWLPKVLSHFYIPFHYYYYYSGMPLILSTMGQIKLAVLKGFFLQEYV